VIHRLPRGKLPARPRSGNSGELAYRNLRLRRCWNLRRTADGTGQEGCPPGRAATYFVLGLACFGLLLVATGWPLFGATLAGVFGLATAEFLKQNKVLHPVRLARYERGVDLARVRA